MDRYVAGLYLAGVGDALGYKNGQWEFCKSGQRIHDEVNALGGIQSLQLISWNISDDQVMHLHTARALVRAKDNLDTLVPLLVEEYILSCDDMEGRAPGGTVLKAVDTLKTTGVVPGGVPFDKSAGGCGAAMRAMCIGLRFYNRLDDLLKYSIEAGRLTHNHPTGFLGSLVSALFASFAINGVPLVEWGRTLVNQVLPKAYEYLESAQVHWSDYQQDLHYFEQKWKSYLTLRKISNLETSPTYPEKFGIQDRDYFYSSISFGGWGGASGHDSVIIAYDALLACNGSFTELANHGMWHGGDSDSTGCIAASLYGCLYGFSGVPENLLVDLEYGDLANQLGEQLFCLSHGLPFDDKLIEKPKGCPQAFLRVIQRVQENLNDIKRVVSEKRLEEGSNMTNVYGVVNEELTKMLCTLDAITGEATRQKKKELISSILSYAEELK